MSNLSISELISGLVSEFTQCSILFGIMYFGTKLINYYYNFYHIYNYLDYQEKLGYFKNNKLVNFISKYIFLKRIIVYYIIIPLIKINYLFIFLFITMLYSLCHIEFKNYIMTQNKTQSRNKIKKKVLDKLISNESSNNLEKSLKEDIFEKNDIEKTNNLIDENNNNEENNNYNNNEEEIKLSKLSNINIKYINDISTDYDENMFNIMNFMSDSNSNSNLNSNLLIKTENNIIKMDFKENKQNIQLENVNVVNKNVNVVNKNLNLLDELNLLEKDSSINTVMSISDNSIGSNKKKMNNLEDNFLQNTETNNLLNENTIENDNDINDYLIINTKNENLILKEEKNNLTKLYEENNNEIINYDDVDFGENIEDLDLEKIKKINTNININIDKNKKNIIRISKKKK